MFLDVHISQKKTSTDVSKSLVRYFFSTLTRLLLCALCFDWQISYQVAEMRNPFIFGENQLEPSTKFSVTVISFTISIIIHQHVRMLRVYSPLPR